MRKQYQFLITSAKRVVIKIGSSLLLDKQGNISLSRINAFVDLIEKLRQSKKEVILVSSGAVASVKHLYPSSKKNSLISLQRKQALASIGQVYLMEKYRYAFKKKNLAIAQILISKFSINHRESYLNARNTINELLSLKVVPIINENDPLATEEFRFGENDILGALTSGLVEANLYIIFSDVDGFFKNYLHDPEHLPLITKITPSLFKEITSSPTNYGSGGMEAKLKAAKIASNFKIPTLLISGKKKNLYDSIFTKQDGTLIINYDFKQKNFNAKKRWLFSNVSPRAKMIIDQGAVKAVKAGKSLLPSGVVNLQGLLHEGDICEIVDEKGGVVARGLSNFNKKDLLLIKGFKTSQIEKLLNRTAHHEVVHCNNLALAL